MAEADEALSQAKGLIRAGRFDEAVALLESWLEKNPEGADGWAALGAAYFESEDYEAAASAARRAVDLRPESARAWCNMATVLRKCGELEEARTCCERALDLSPDYTRAKAELRKLRTGPLPPPPEPTTVAEEGRGQCPECGVSTFENDQFCMNCGYDFALRAGTAEAGQEKRRAFLEWAVDKALSRNQLGKAETHLRELLDIHPDSPSILFRLADIQEEQGAYERALATLQRLYEVTEGDKARDAFVDCALQLAFMKQKRYRFREAEAVCKQAREVVGDDRRLEEQLEEIAEAEVSHTAQESAHRKGRQQRVQAATTAGGFGAVTGALTMIAGVLLIMLSLAMVPCCIGIFFLPVAFSVFAAGVAMLAGAPAGGAAVYTIGELPRAMRRFGDYWESLTPQARNRVGIGIAVAIGVIVVLAVLGSVVGAIPAGGGGP